MRDQSVRDAPQQGGEGRMKSDDPELEKRQKEISSRAQNMDPLILSILKTHLLTEQCMNDYIEASGLKKQWIRKRFSDKMKKCKLISKEEAGDPLWGVLEAANLLRNTVAHTLEIVKIKEKMAVLKEKYLASLTEEQAAGLRDRPDDFIAMSACSTCAGFIATLRSRIPGSQTA